MKKKAMVGKFPYWFVALAMVLIVIGVESTFGTEFGDVFLKNSITANSNSREVLIDDEGLWREVQRKYPEYFWVRIELALVDWKRGQLNEARAKIEALNDWELSPKLKEELLRSF